MWKVRFPFGDGCLRNRLKEIREQRSIRQEELADALRVSRQTIGSLENGRYNPSILLAFKIARYFGISLEDIFLYEEEEKHEKIKPWIFLLPAIAGAAAVYIGCFVLTDRQFKPVSAWCIGLGAAAFALGIEKFLDTLYLFKATDRRIYSKKEYRS